MYVFPRVLMLANMTDKIVNKHCSQSLAADTQFFTNHHNADKLNK